MASTFIVGLEQVVQHMNNLSDGLRDLNGLRATIGTPLPYAEAVHEGSRAHDIFPRNKRALFWPGAAHPVTHVHHPGTKANPFLRDVFESRRGAIIQSVADGLGEAIRNGELSSAGPFGQAMDKTLELAQEATPVRSGNLRQSLHGEFYSR